MVRCNFSKFLLFVLPLLGLVGCGGDDVLENVEGVSGFKTPAHPKFAKKAYNRPYVIKGETYTPHSHYELDEIGIASYYGGTDVFHGRKTSNGEIFDMNRSSGAHKHLLIPCIVQVTNLENGRSLKVKINDRGPFIEGRVIDVSRKVAQMLGFYKKGTAKVHVRTVLPDTLQLVNGELDDETLQMAEVVHNPHPFVPEPGSLMPAPIVPSLSVDSVRGTTPLVLAGASMPKHMTSNTLGEISSVSHALPEAPSFEDRIMPAYEAVSSITTESLMPEAPRTPRLRPAFGKSRLAPTSLKRITNTVSAKARPRVPALPKLVKGNRGYFVQAITVRDAKAAQKVAKQLRQTFPTGMVRMETTQFGQTAIHRLLLGPFKSKPEAGTLLKKVSSLGHEDAVVVYN